MANTGIDFYKKVHRMPRLESAWRQVHENGMQSSSSATKLEVQEWAKHARGGLLRLQRGLRDGSFRFLPQRGVAPRKRSGKGHRPIVLAPIESRIVQRAILEVLLSQPQLRRLAQVPSSFGGIRKRGVPAAIAAVVSAVDAGARFFLRSDIKDFFTRIPRQRVLEKVSQVIPDARFLALLEAATTTELSNLEVLRALADLFPIYELGVAQGCALSPFFGNLLLTDFDRGLNGRGVVCLRYIDDFLILGRRPSQVLGAFESAQEILGGFSMDAYDPRTDAGKAQMGDVTKGFTFLGCELRPGLIRPTKASRKRLLRTVHDRLKQSLETMTGPVPCALGDQAAADTLVEVGNIVRSWGNQYKFCSDRGMMAELDRAVSAMVIEYLKALKGNMRRSIGAGEQEEWRRLLGVHLLVDSKYEPIQPFKL